MIGTFVGEKIKSLEVGATNLLSFLKSAATTDRFCKLVKHRTNASHYFGTVDSKGRPEGLGMVIHEDGKLN